MCIVNKQKRRKGELQNMRSKPWGRIILILILFLTFLILDYVNVPTLIGLLPANINMDVFCVLFDTFIVLVLYVISFYYIENRQNEKDANARDTVEVLIKKTYQECLDNLRFLDNRATIENYIIPKMDMNKPDSENKVVHNLQTLPFASYDAVIDLAVSGHIEKKNFDDYLEIKKEYQYLVSQKIIFFDLVIPKTEEQRVMLLHIEEKDKALKCKLEELLAKMDAKE